MTRYFFDFLVSCKNFLWAAATSWRSSISDSDGDVLACDNTSISLSSSNTALIDSSDMTLGGVAPNCTLLLDSKNNQFGSSTITLTLSDGNPTSADASENFLLTVTGINDLPIIGANETENGTEDTVLNFTIGNAATDADGVIG